MGRLRGKKAIITGAGSGIGRAIAMNFVDEGAEVVLVGRNEEKLQDTLDRIRQNGELFSTDISLEEDVSALKQFVKDHFGELDILVNNAGTVLRNENLLETTEERWETFMSINLKGVFLMCKAMIPLMLKNQLGSIVNISSQLALISVPGYSTYSTAKGGILSFTRSLAIDYGPDGIRANCISPGIIDTPMAYKERENFDDLRESIADKHPLKRVGRVEDITSGVVYLASDESSWVTGTNLVIDGGFTST